MDKLLTFAYNELKKTGYKVYDKVPPKGADYPMIQYNINQSFRNKDPLLYTLTVDVWDRSNSTQKVELLTNEIDENLEGKNYTDEHIQVRVLRQSRLRIDDPDLELKRRQLNYQLRVFYKE